MWPIDELRRALEGDATAQLAVIFGSAARGAQRNNSDLDVGVLGVAADQLSALQLTLARATGRSVDLVALETAPPLLRFEIAREGHVLIERSSHLWSDFKAKAMIDWWDWAPSARLFHRAAAARLRDEMRRGPA
jgi:predicted nucleotidyltransferase